MTISPLPAAASVPTTNGPFQPGRQVAQQDVLHALQQDGAEHGRYEQQKREARGRVAVELEQPSGGDRDPRAGDARHQRQALRESHPHRRLQAEIAHRPPLRLPVGIPEDERADGQRDRDLPRLPQVRRDRVLAEQTDRGGGDRRHEDEPGDPLLPRLDPARPQRPEPRGHEHRRCRARSSRRPRRACPGAAPRRTSG